MNCLLILTSNLNLHLPAVTSGSFGDLRHRSLTNGVDRLISGLYTFSAIDTKLVRLGSRHLPTEVWQTFEETWQVFDLLSCCILMCT